MTKTYDNIVVGGGAAGCVAAARLVAAGRRVLLLEGGYSNRHPLLDMPPGIAKRCDKEIGRAVDHLGLVGEIGSRIDKARELDRPHKAGKVAAAGLFHLREQRDGAAFRGGVCGAWLRLRFRLARA